MVAGRELLRWPFNLSWSLLDLHLERLEPDDFLWEPAPGCFTVRPNGPGGVQLAG